jgi:hypothetical protein
MTGSGTRPGQVELPVRVDSSVRKWRSERPLSADFVEKVGVAWVGKS